MVLWCYAAKMQASAYEKNVYAICSGLGALETTLKGTKVYQRGVECLGVTCAKICSN